MIYYFLKTILLLATFYMLYTLLLKQHTAYRWNRMYLLITSVAAICIPMISTSFGQTINNNPVLKHTIDTLTVYVNALQQHELHYAKVIFLVVLAGILWGLTRIAVGLYILYKLKENASSEQIGETTVYFHSQIDTPFSFFSFIYLPESFRHKEALPIVLKHEEAHIALHHSYDKFYFSLLQAFFWFNPFVYRYHKAIELQHQFEADAYSVQQIETDQYVHNFLEAIAYSQAPTLLVHSFFHHSLTTRMTMLCKKSNRLMMQKTLLVCGIVLVLSLTLVLSRGTCLHVPQFALS